MVQIVMCSSGMAIGARAAFERRFRYSSPHLRLPGASYNSVEAEAWIFCLAADPNLGISSRAKLPAMKPRDVLFSHRQTRKNSIATNGYEIIVRAEKSPIFFSLARCACALVRTLMLS
jgi:hypothetical protein